MQKNRVRYGIYFHLLAIIKQAPITGITEQINNTCFTDSRIGGNMKLFHLEPKKIQEYNIHIKDNASTVEHRGTAGQGMIKSKSSLKLLKHPHNQFRSLLLLFLLVFSGIAMGFINAKTKNSDEIQNGIAKEIIRFHVIANSDSSEDQNLKLKVKDTLVRSLSPYLENADSREQASQILTDKLSYMKDIAEEVIRLNGYNYPVTVTLEPAYFPIKIYGDYTFPPGMYDALRVKIGAAEGQNWWCVMFPPLCFVDETYSIVDESSDKQLKYLLTEEEYESLRSRKVPVKIKFKLWESIKKLLN
jgi:stage II sporulation protein R